MPLGKISNVIETLSLTTSGKSSAPRMLEVRPGIIAFVIGHSGSTGSLGTFDVAAGGDLGSVKDSLTFENTAWHRIALCLVSPGILALAYHHYLNAGHLVTYAIDSEGAINHTPIDTLTYIDEGGDGASLVSCGFNDIFAVASDGAGNNGYITTFSIDSDGYISDSPLASYEFDGGMGLGHSLVNITGNIFASFYQGNAYYPTVRTFEIKNDGSIAIPENNSLTLEEAHAVHTVVLKVGPSKFSCCYDLDTYVGKIKTITINDQGSIAETFASEFDFPDAVFRQSDFIHVGNNCHAVVYRGVDDDGWIKTTSIDSGGNIADIIDDNKFQATFASDPSCIRISGDILLIAYIGDDNYAYVSSLGITSISQTHHEMIMGMGP